ncbi:unannotated protein [freshwater metagenome]|uniref:Unannotated protein n=1 Tax=freshwater metagenome TaxID=449393 RepID=A0A6J6Y7N2_9ZZZZ
MVGEESTDRPTGGVGQPVVPAGVHEGVGPLGSPQRKIHVEPAAARRGEGLAHEREVQTLLAGDLLGHQLEHRNVVNGLERTVVVQGELELRGVVLGVRRFHREPGANGALEHVVDETVRIGDGAGLVHDRPGGGYRAPAAAAVRLQREGLQLDAYVGVEAEGLPQCDCVAEHRSGRHVE